MPFPLPFAFFRIWDVLERGRRVVNASTSQRVYLPLSVIAWPSWVLMQTVPGHKDDNHFSNPTNNHPFSGQRDRQACDRPCCLYMQSFWNIFEAANNNHQIIFEQIQHFLAKVQKIIGFLVQLFEFVTKSDHTSTNSCVCACAGCWLGEYPGVDKMISWTQSHVDKATRAQFDIGTLSELDCFLSTSPWQVWEATDLSKLLDLFTITEVLPIQHWCVLILTREWQPTC